MAPRAAVPVGAHSGSWLKRRNRSSAKSSRCQRRPMCGTRSARSRRATTRTRTGLGGAAHRGETREHHGYRRAGHAGQQAPGQGGRPLAAERAGNLNHTCAPARQPARQRLTRGENFRCAELAMTPVKCHSQPTPCAYKGNLARVSCLPLRTPTAARLSPARGRAGGVAPLLPGGALTADSPHRGCRRPRVVGEARRPAGAAGVACARPWLGRRGRAVLPVAGATTVLPLLSLLRTRLSPVGEARAWCYPRKTNP